MREALQFALRTYDLMVVPKDSVHCLAAAIAVAVAFVGHLVASSAVAADDSGIGCIGTKPPRSLLCQPAECMIDQDPHRMALLVHSADHHSEGCSLDCHAPTVGGTNVCRQSSEWLERKEKATLSGRAAVGLEG